MQILILDDDELFGRTLQHSLKRQSELALDITVTTTAEEARQAVAAAGQRPFDVFLIDHRLGPGPDGISVFQELRQINSTAEAIIFTGYDDPNAGLEAYRAGAYRYLAKPFDTRELGWILLSLRKWHDTQYERDWLQILSEVAEDTQHALAVRDVADIVAQGGLRLGFERARLWRFSAESGSLVGLSEAGNRGLETFAGCRLSLAEAPYAQKTILAHEPMFFQARELGESFLDRQFARRGFLPPLGEWVQLPLWAGRQLWGVLALDNASQARQLRSEQRRLLGLFGRQVTAALERAHLHDLEERTRKELAILNQIGQRVTTRAALDDLSRLLREVRVLVGELFDTRNFNVVLLDDETGQLDVALRVENGRVRQRHWQPLGADLVSHLIASNDPLLLAEGEREYCARLGIPLSHRPAQCWMGVPLRVGSAAVGAIVVKSYGRAHDYGREDLRLLAAVADQVAGVIQAAHLKDQEAESSRQLELLHHASEEIMQLAEENEDWLWQASLTAATAEYALSFNRAIAFLAEEGGARLRGRMGVGHLDSRSARHDWNRDHRSHLDFAEYIRQLRAGRQHPTPLEQLARDWLLDLRGGGDVFSQVLRSGRRAIVPAAENNERLPAAFVERFGPADYAVVPIRSGRRVLGLVVADNVHDQKPLRDRLLDRLETLFAQAALTLEVLQQRNARDALISLNHTILSEIDARPLAKTLVKVAEAARTVTRADYVVIYPLRSSREPFDFDLDSAGRSGNEQAPRHTGPRPDGMSHEVLSSGEPLIVNDVATHPEQYGVERMNEHPSLLRERIRAVIGMPVRDVMTNELCGILYLNYRTPQNFTEQDTYQAKSFANLSAVAIRNHRSTQRIREGLAAAERERQDREDELEILRGVLEQALADVDERTITGALLRAASRLLERSDLRIGLFLRAWEKPSGRSLEPREVRVEYFLREDGSISEGRGVDVFQGISGHAFQHGLTQRFGDVRADALASDFRDDSIDTRSELDIPIRLGTQVIGVFNVESPHPDAFSAAHQDKLERLAAAGSLALDNSRRQKHLHNVLSAAQAVVAPFGLQETLNAVLEAARQAAPDLSTLTIWYNDPKTERIRLGPRFGVRHEAELEHKEPTKGGVIETVLAAREPIWATDAPASEQLRKRFVDLEGIVSTAAFPLRAGDGSIGAMFFSYRKRHEFTREEYALFPTLAAITAASIRDALLLEQAKHERDRLMAALEITEALGTKLDLNEIFQQIMATLRDLLQHAQPSVLTLTYDAQERMLEFTSASSEFYQIDQAGQIGRTRVPLEGPSLASRLARESLASGQVHMLNVGDVRREPEYLSLIAGTQSELCLTLMSGEQLLGVLVLESPQPNAFDADDAKLLHGVARQMSLAIDRAYQSAQLSFKTTVAGATAWATEIAHDINREVSQIRSRTYWIAEEADLPAKIYQYGREIEQSAQQLASALGGIQHLPGSTLALDDWLRRRVEAIVRERGAEIQIAWQPGCPDQEILVPAVALDRVLRHLVRNALEAMGGKGCLTISTRHVDDGWIEARIADSGPGVPDQVRQVVFKQRISTKGEDGGLGLLFVRFIVEDLIGGNVRLLPSEAGQGAMFAMKLPLRQERHGNGTTKT